MAVPTEPLIIQPDASAVADRVVRGTMLVIGDWPAEGLASEVAPLHVHHADDEAWHVVSGALRFRFNDQVIVAQAGATVLVPAGVPHTFGNAGPDPSRFLIVLPPRLDQLITELHAGNRQDHASIYQKYESQLLE
jgi:mannose-6-phosphate isomerase-like protein (cupin superfamily)